MTLLWAALPCRAATLVDQVGNPVAIGPAHRIVALAPDVTEIAFALGLGSRVVAVSTAADFPTQARSLPHISSTDVESILLMRPDLVLATTAGDDPRTIARLTSLGVRVLTVDVTSCERLVAACDLIERVAVEDPSGALGRSLAARCAAVDRLAAPLPLRTALYVVWWDPLIVAAPGTFHDDMLRRVRLTNLAPAGAGRYPRVDPELLLDPRPEVVVAPDEPDVRAGFDAVLARPEGSRLARGEVRVIWLPADQASRPGPRLVDAMERLLADRMAMEAAR